MAQLINEGKPVCRWCKEPLTRKDLASATRPREVHPQHVTPRKNGLASGRWTRPMDDALTMAEVELLQRRPSLRGGVLIEEAEVLQSVLNGFLTSGGSASPELVQALVAASARLLEAMRSEVPDASTGS